MRTGPGATAFIRIPFGMSWRAIDRLSDNQTLTMKKQQGEMCAREREDGAFGAGIIDHPPTSFVGSDRRGVDAAQRSARP